MLFICHWRHREIAYAFVFVLFIFNRSYYVHHLHYWKWIEEYKTVKQLMEGIIEFFFFLFSFVFSLLFSFLDDAIVINI